MKFLIAGTGSIGQRHIRNLCQLRSDVEFMFLRKNGFADELSIKLNACVVPTLMRRWTMRLMLWSSPLRRRFIVNYCYPR